MAMLQNPENVVSTKNNELQTVTPQTEETQRAPKRTSSLGAAVGRPFQVARQRTGQTP